MRHRRILALILLIILLLTSGCWDKVEIEQRAFILSMSLDMNDKQTGSSNESSSNTFSEEKDKSIKVIFGMANPSKLQGGGSAFLLRTITAADIPDAMEKLTSSTSRVPFFAQTKLIMFSEKFLNNKDAFMQALDDMERSPDLNPEIKVVAVKGSMEDILKIKPKLENLFEAYVTGVMENSKMLSSTINVSAGEMLAQIRENNGYAIMPVVEIKRDDIEITKLALIKDYKLLSYIDTQYVKGYKMITGQIDSGREFVNYNGALIPFNIASSNRRIWLEQGSDGLKYRIRIEFEGTLEEYKFGQDLFNTDRINAVKSQFENSIKQELGITTKYFQDTIGHDYLKLGEYTHKFHNGIYQKYKDNWDEAFKNAQVDYEIEVRIRRIGVSKE